MQLACHDTFTDLSWYRLSVIILLNIVDIDKVDTV